MSKRSLLDSVIVFVCCVCVMIIFTGNFDLITFLISVCVVSLRISFSKEAASYILNIIFIAICIAIPQLIYMYPIFIYQSIYIKNKLPLLLLNFVSFIAISFVLSFDYKIIAAVMLISLGSLLISIRAFKLTELEHRLVFERDDNAEKELSLKNKNKSLLEKQDYEIYLATLKERNRIAREIHDNVGHLLSRSILQTGALIAVTDKDKMPLQYEHAQGLKETLSTAMNSIRESVHGLRDDSIDLHYSINEAISEIKNDYHVTTELDFSEKMPPDIKLCFIAIIKEAVSNLVKYSNASKFSISVREHPAIYQLLIQDNGTEIEKTVSGGGMGLSNMQERVKSLGGIIKIDTDNGFRIFVSVGRKT